MDQRQESFNNAMAEYRRQEAMQFQQELLNRNAFERRFESPWRRPAPLIWMGERLGLDLADVLARQARAS